MRAEVSEVKLGRRPEAGGAVAERRGYRPREIARLYGLAPSTVYDAIAAGRLRAHRVGVAGRAVVVPIDALNDWLGGEAA